MEKKEFLNKARMITSHHQDRNAYNLFLDDVRVPEDVGRYIVPAGLQKIYLKQDWTIVRSFKAFADHIRGNGLPEMMSFDHDLDAEGNPGNSSYLMTGYDCAKWLISYIEEHNLLLPVILCHSMNPVGRKNIEALFEGYCRYLSGK